MSTATPKPLPRQPTAFRRRSRAAERRGSEFGDSDFGAGKEDRPKWRRGVSSSAPTLPHRRREAGEAGSALSLSRGLSLESATRITRQPQKKPGSPSGGTRGSNAAIAAREGKLGLIRGPRKREQLPGTLSTTRDMNIYTYVERYPARTHATPRVIYARRRGRPGRAVTSHFGPFGRVSGFVFTSEQARRSCFRFSSPRWRPQPRVDC